MGKYLNFENEEKGYKPFSLTNENIRKNFGKKICFVLNRDVCKHRGYYNVRYGVMHSKRYSMLYIDEGHTDIDIRDVLECGIEIEDEKDKG